MVIVDFHDIDIKESWTYRWLSTRYIFIGLLMIVFLFNNSLFKYHQLIALLHEPLLSIFTIIGLQQRSLVDIVDD